MAIIQSKINASSREYKENAAAMQVQVDELKAAPKKSTKGAVARPGASPKSR